MKRIFVISALLLSFFSCKKSDDATPITSPPSSIVKSDVTKISFVNNGAAQPSVIYFTNRTVGLSGFDVKPDGTYQIRFYGKNGQDILQGAAVGITTNTAKWHINIGDTIRIFQNAIEKYQYITNIEDNVNDGIIFTSIGETEAQAKNRFISYIHNTLPSTLFALKP